MNDYDDEILTATISIFRKFVRPGERTSVRETTSKSLMISLERSYHFDGDADLATEKMSEDLEQISRSIVRDVRFARKNPFGASILVSTGHITLDLWAIIPRADNAPNEVTIEVEKRLNEVV